MIATLKVTLVRGMYCEDDWSANIELDESSTLAELHDAIQMAVDFDNDHSFSFFVSRTERSRDRQYFHDEDKSVDSKTVKNSFPLPDKHSLYYLFDWGDDWIFKVSKTRKSLQQASPGVNYPRVESESGTRPEQYPSFDDEEGEEGDDEE
jgi:Plasmid pRiA4b ORF-3-like protein